MHAYIHTYIHACMHACIHTYIHTYVYICISLYIYNYHIMHVDHMEEQQPEREQGLAAGGPPGCGRPCQAPPRQPTSWDRTDHRSTAREWDGGPQILTGWLMGCLALNIVSASPHLYPDQCVCILHCLLCLVPSSASCRVLASRACCVLRAACCSMHAANRDTEVNY